MIFLVFLFLHLAISTGSTSQLEDADDDNGGHSSEFKPMGYEWKMTELEYTPDLLDEIHTLTNEGRFFPRAQRAEGHLMKNFTSSTDLYQIS